MPALPAFVEACPATMALIGRALLGSLPRSDYYDAWDALGEEAAQKYDPSEEVRIWMHANWKTLMPTVAKEGQTGCVGELSAGPISAVSAVPDAHAPIVVAPPVLSEAWMQPFLDEYVLNGGVHIQAAKKADVHRDTVRNYLKSDPEFARALLLAEEERKGVVEAAKASRKNSSAVRGQMGVIRKADDMLLIGELLRRHKAERRRASQTQRQREFRARQKRKTALEAHGQKPLSEGEGESQNV